MPIAAAEVIPYWLPFRDEYVTARGRLERREMVLLRLVDEEGREGWGEAVPLSLRGGADLARVLGDLRAWSEQAQGSGEATYAEAVSEGLETLAAPARCAVLTALADLEARRLEIPVWQLLGARASAAVPCNATLVSGPPASVAADAARWAADGFATFKLKVGLLADGPVSGRGASGRHRRGAPDPDLSQIEAVREAVGPDARIRLDANGAWSVDRAEAVLRAAGPLGIELIEQPVSSISEMAELRRRLKHPRRKPSAGAGHGKVSTQIPLAADESVNGPADAVTAREAAACDLATVKLSKVGSLRPELAGALPFYLSSALDGPVGIAAAGHAFQALTNAERASLPAHAGAGEPALDDDSLQPLAQGLATQRLFSEAIALRECDLEGPLLHLPSGPGLGVEIDRVALAAHRL